ncbi:MAG: M28 family peptidase [Myxococcota bacterium]
MALRADVAAFAIPRHYEMQRRANRDTHDRLADSLCALGYSVRSQGRFRNVVALPSAPRQPVTLVCAHYDSVPTTPGADDNASALAVLLEVARRCAGRHTRHVAFVGFNGEEDGLLGSRDFVAQGMAGLQVASAHVLEMVGYTSREPNSQAAPPRLPRILPTVGDFVAVVGGGAPQALAHVAAASRGRGMPRVVRFDAPRWLHRTVPDLLRSDHAPFWAAGVPALMWTDTGNFRNPHYHRETDTPDTLDYGFMSQVANLLHAVVGARGVY